MLLRKVSSQTVGYFIFLPRLSTIVLLHYLGKQKADNCVFSLKR